MELALILTAVMTSILLAAAMTAITVEKKSRKIKKDLPVLKISRKKVIRKQTAASK